MKRLLIATLAATFGCVTVADAHTLKLRTARATAERALGYDGVFPTNVRVRLSDCVRWTRHKVICQGTWEEDNYPEAANDYCLATINVRFQSRYAYRRKTWIHSRQCF